MDWTATILAAARIKKIPSFHLDGINLLPIIRGKKVKVDRTFYWRTFQRTKQKALREGNWKYLQDEKGEYLFDLATDQAEKNNLKEGQKVIFDRLKNKYMEWEKTVLTPLPL